MLEAKFLISLTSPMAVLSVGDGIEDLLGFKPADFLSNKVTIQDRIHAHDHDIAEQIFSPSPTPAAVTFNIRLRQANGRIRCVKGQYSKVPDASGVATRLELLLQDAKSLWHENTEQSMTANFTALMDNTDDFIYFKDRNHVFTGASQALVKITENTQHWKEFLGVTDYDVFAEEYADIYYRLEKQVFAGFHVAHDIQETRDQQGHKGWVNNRKFPIKNAAGEIVGLFGMARDITEAKQAELALRESEESLRDSQTIAGLGTYVLNISEDTWTSSDLLDQILGIDSTYPHTFAAWPALIHPEDRAMLNSYLSDEVLGKGQAFNKEYRILRHVDQVERWVHGLGKLEFDGEGRPQFMRGTIQDITSRRQELLDEKRAILGNRLVGLVTVRDRKVVWANAAFETMLGYGSDELIGAETRQFYKSEADYLSLEESYAQAMRSGMVRIERQYLRKDGQPIWVDMSAALMHKESGEFLWTFIDITARKLAENKLQLAASVFSHAREGIMITEPDGAIIEVNEAFTRITGYGRDEVLGQNPRLLKSGRHGSEFYVGLWQSLRQQGYFYGEIWNRRKGGEVFAAMQTISAVRNEQGEIGQYVSLFSDITAVKKHEKQLERLAHFDVLTDLPNRALLADRLHQAMAQALRRGQRLAVAFLDLDGFKAINDRHGHEAGDHLLIALAQRMKLALREGDTLARMGGDEFVAVLIDQEDAATSTPMLTRLLEAAAETVQFGEVVLQVSASLGLTFYPQDDHIDADQLLRQADQAMYQAKLAGKNRYHVFNAEQDRSIRVQHEGLVRIRQALDADEFVLHYQPKVNMRTGAVIGAEALIRWQHPEQGLLPPISFLPLIEDHPLAIAIGEWVVDSALTQMEQWRLKGLGLTVSVNIGARQFQQVDFVARLRDILAAHPQIVPGNLELEVLETSALEDMTHVSKVMEDCQKLGISFALDDFGTGYSSLTYLKRLPVSTLKIDRSFVMGMLDDPDDRAILEGVIGLARAFRREVIAEGVETIAHGSMLLQLGCDLAQGYGIARPMPANALPGWAATWRPDPVWVSASNQTQYSSIKRLQTLSHTA